MPERLPALRPREFIRALERAGFVQSHQTGSHVILYRQGWPKPVSVPSHNRDMKRGLVVGLLRDAGITQQELLALL